MWLIKSKYESHKPPKNTNNVERKLIQKQEIQVEIPTLNKIDLISLAKYINTSIK